MPSAAETKNINDELHKLGFGNLKDPGLVPAIAYYIKSHEQFRSQLFSVMPDKRKIAYDSLRPHLRFEAKPLDVYEAEMKLEAEKQQWGRYNQHTHMVDPFKVGEVGERLEKVAEKAIEAAEEEQRWLHLICVKCTAMDSYGATTRNDADLMATEKGWRQSDGKSYCKKCARKYLIH